MADEDSTRDAVIRLEEQVKNIAGALKDLKDAQLQGFRDVSQIIEQRATSMSNALATHALENKSDFKDDRASLGRVADRVSVLESGKIWILGAVSILTTIIGLGMWYVSTFWKDINVERRTTTTEEVRKAPEEKPIKGK